MSDKPGIVVAGADGRMGRMLLQTVLESGACRLAGALVQDGSDWIGRDAGRAIGLEDAGVEVTADVDAALERADALIDFTAPAATVDFAKRAAERGVVHVIGTTGLSDDDLAQLSEAAKRTVLVRAGNMSLGVNLLVQLTKKVAAALDEAFDIEITEAHHARKVDAPSGTALMLGEAAAEGRGVNLREVEDRARDGQTGAREEGHIGFSVIRGGDIVGEHEVLFAGPGERVALKHVATDRGIFARGAVKAALWGQGRTPGDYSMVDVLGL